MKSLLAVALPLCLCGSGVAQLSAGEKDATARNPVQWAEAAAHCEEGILHYDHNALLEYKIHRRDSKGETTRLVMENLQGSVARLLQRNGQKLTAEEDAAERQRLQAILDDPETYLRHEQRDDGSRAYALEVLHSFPAAMSWSYAAGQPQLGGFGPVVVLDFKPDPKFKPPSLITESLTGVSGRVWVDRGSGCVVRIDGGILHPINFGWGGVLARIKQGGTVQVEQRRTANGRWLLSHFVEHLSIREVLVHTEQEDGETVTYDVQPLPTPITFRQAVQQLLALPVPTR